MDKNIASDSEDIGNNLAAPNLEKSDVVSSLQPEIVKNLFICSIVDYLLILINAITL